MSVDSVEIRENFAKITVIKCDFKTSETIESKFRNQVVPLESNFGKLVVIKMEL